MKKNLFIIMILLLGCTVICAQDLTPLLAWNFSGVSTSDDGSGQNDLSMSATTQNQGLISGILTRGNGAMYGKGSNGWRTFWKNSIADDISNDVYFQFSLQVTEGKSVSLSGITVKVYGDGQLIDADNAVMEQFAYSLTGNNDFKLIGSPHLITDRTDANQVNYTVDLTGISDLQNVSNQKVIFVRYYAASALTEANPTRKWGFYSGSGGPDGLIVNGTVSGVSALENMSVSNIHTSLKENLLQLSNVNPGSLYNIYNAGGTHIAKGMIKGTTLEVTLPGKGLYIVRIAGNSVKILNI